jgi:hypothetical protein
MYVENDKFINPKTNEFRNKQITIQEIVKAVDL